jgi:hypothetical protein
MAARGLAGADGRLVVIAVKCSGGAAAAAGKGERERGGAAVLGNL